MMLTATHSFSRGLLTLALGGALSAQAESWREMLNASCAAPAPRLTATLAYDAVRQRVVLAGGAGTGTTLYGDTWEYDGAEWQERYPATVSPPARYAHAMVFDGQRIILFGGRTDTTRFNDMWAWDGVDWQQLQPGGQLPQPRNSHGLAYDSVRQCIVLFGGQVGPPLTTQAIGDTWEYQNGVWTQHSGISPSPRMEHGFVFDLPRQACLLFGGREAGNPNLADTWTWNGSSWLQQPPGPPGRRSHGMAYDAFQQKVVMFGGLGAPDPTYLPDTWEWNGVWTPGPASGPPSRYEMGMASLDSLRTVVLFGGGNSSVSGRFGDTWEYAAFAECTSRGVGCSGSAGIPVLDCTATPVIGTTCTLTVGPVPINGILIMLHGAAQDPGVPLGGIGMPGCHLYVLAPTAVVVPGTGSSRMWSFFVPANPALVGAELAVQAAATDSGLTPPALGLVASNAVDLVVGAR